MAAAPSQSQIVGVDRGRAVTVAFGCGLLRYYERTRRLVAECKVETHNIGDKCHMTRTVLPSRFGHRAGQGRPLGKLAAFLLTGRAHVCKHDHFLEGRLGISDKTRGNSWQRWTSQRCDSYSQVRLRSPTPATLMSL